MVGTVAAGLILEFILAARFTPRVFIHPVTTTHLITRATIPPTIVMPSTPPVYIENSAPAIPAKPPGQWWFYCSDSQAYYPTVAQCASPWQLVAPQVVAPQVVAPQGTMPQSENQ